MVGRNFGQCVAPEGSESHPLHDLRLLFERPVLHIVYNDTVRCLDYQER